MRKRTFFWMTAAFCLGMLLSEARAAVWLLAFLVGIGIGAIFMPKFRKSCLFILIGLSFGFLLFMWHFTGYENTLDKIEGTRVILSGRIEAIQTGETPRIEVRGRIESEENTIDDGSFYVYPESVNDYSYGDEIKVQTVIGVPARIQNFGESQYRPYSMGKNLYGFLYPKPEEIEKTGYSFSYFRPKDMAYAARNWLKGRLRGWMNQETESFLFALLMGDQSALYEKDAVSLQRAGLSHIVAVSGMHLQVLVCAMMTLFGILRIRKRWFSVCCYLLFIWFFVIFTGASPSVLRAALMLTVFFFADFLRRDRDTLTALAFAAFFLCLANPGILFNIGFQLSCISTLSILLFSGKIEARISFLPRFLRVGLSVTTAAFLGFAPLAARYFGFVSILGVLANLLVCPVVTPVMVLGFLVGLLPHIPILSTLLFKALEWIVGYILAVAGFISSLPFSVQAVKSPGTLLLVAYLALFIGLYFVFEKRRRYAARALLIAMALTTMQLFGTWMVGHTTKVAFLQVGNGDCALATKGKTALLFDSGGSTETDVAENTIIPYIRRKGIKEIEAAFLTHYHMDHAAGYLTLMKEGMVRTLYVPYHADDDLKPSLAAVAMQTGTTIRYLGDGDTVECGAFSISAFDSDTGTSENNGLVYRMEILGTRFLFTGDINKEAERRLVWRGADIDCNVLKVPHHGANTSGSAEFTEATSPEIAVISCGKNPYGHPHERTLSFYKKQGIPVYRTDQNGTVEITLLPIGLRYIRTLWP